jgi:predicted DNA-binding protein
MATDLTKFKIINFPLPIATVDRLDRLAEMGGLSRAKLLTNMVEAGIDFLEGCEGWGVFAVRKIFDDMKLALSKRIKYKIA